MEALVKRELFLEGLDCANCADKIEKESAKIKNVSNATLDFMSGKLVVEFVDKSNEDRIVKEVTNIVKKHEPDVKVHKDAKPKGNIAKDRHVQIIVVRLGVGGVLFAIGMLLNLSLPLEFTLFFLAFLFAGYDVVLAAIKNVIKGHVFDENFLMSVATLGAFSIGQFSEGVAVMLFYQVGELFQHLAVRSSRRSIEKLMDIRPDFANLKRGVKIVKVSPEVVKPGDFIMVKPGEKVPLDGIVTKGDSSVDTSALTGEAVPRGVHVGDEVYGGFINKSGLITIKVTKEFGESTVSKILELVQNASSKKAQTENFITKFARVYTPVVVISAALLAVIPPLVTGGSFNTWIYRALVFLVVSCPCALVISIPLGFFGGIGAASRAGILIKGSNYLEALNNVDTVVFDKTGTLTKGVFKVTEIKASGNYTKKELLEYAASAESFSNHPIAKSILKEYGKDFDKVEMSNFTELSGLGIEVNVKGKTVVAGNNKLMKKNQVDFVEVDKIGTLVHIAVDGIYAGFIVISDEIKEDSAHGIAALKEIGIKKIAMLTGDSKRVADAVGIQLGIDEVYSELLPDGKVEIFEDIEKRKALKKKVIFVGDGINDAPVLARADIGIAMGGIGSDAAIEAADIVIMTDEPSKIKEAISIARRTNKIVWQNIVFCLAVKLIILVLGVFGLTTIWIAVFGDVGVALIAVLNSMRTLKF